MRLTRAMLVPVALAVVIASCSPSDDQVGTEATILVDAAAVEFDSVSDMASASQLVFVGQVVDVSEGPFQPAPETEDFKGTQSLKITIEVADVFKGDLSPGDAVSIEWSGYDVAEDGAKGPQRIVNGQLPPAVGDRNLWFLGDDGTRFGLVAYEGRLEVDDAGRLRLSGDVDSGAAHELDGLNLDRLSDLVATTDR
jgi:hypothetical protein